MRDEQGSPCGRLVGPQIRQQNDFVPSELYQLVLVILPMVLARTGAVRRIVQVHRKWVWWLSVHEKQL
jgi:hypothetical protein